MAGNFPKPGQKQLFVDISELINRDVKTGIQRVVRSIANSWLANPPADYCVRPVYATLEGGYRHAHKDSPFSTNDPDIMDEPIEFATGDIFVGLDLQVHMVVTQRAFLRELKLRGVAVYFVVYDLLCVTCPECFPEGSHEDFLQWLDVVSESDGAMCISQSVEKELQCWMTENAKKPLGSFYTGWFHLGADVENSLPSKGMPEEAPKVLSQLALRPTFLMVGTLEPRKGHAQVLDAFDLLWQDHQQINLVIIGKPGWLVDDLLSYIQQHSLLNVQLFFLSGISDEYLTKVYAASRCLIAASYDEGFGLPLIEAAQHQLPLIARDIPVFREVAAEQAYYFNSRHPEALATTITQWLNLYENSSHPKSENISWLTWQESANNLLQGIVELQSSEYKSDHGDVK
ncbi:glycosyltransferase family 4 protein [Nitrincola sp.]|uniref:glycosyltransferase family 4 protein n=1 Tax=Nitrincola sp. TaxID=1926584 RepID=UPI003A8ECB23